MKHGGKVNGVGSAEWVYFLWAPVPAIYVMFQRGMASCLPLWSRIPACLQVRKLPKVNAEEHVRLQAASMAAAESSRKQMQQDGAAAEELLQDNRFAAMFEDTDFAIDTSSKVYRELHPNAGAHSAPCQSLMLKRNSNCRVP